MIRLVGGALLLMVSGTAMADPVAYRAIANKDLGAAEAQLTSALAEEASEPGVLLNLAHVYRQTARGAEADALYRRVLGAPDVLMAMPDGRPASSHRLASLGLARSAQFASR